MGLTLTKRTLLVLQFLVGALFALMLSSSAWAAFDSGREVDFWANVADRWECWESTPLGGVRYIWNIDRSAKQITGTYRGISTLGKTIHVVLHVQSFDGRHLVLQAATGGYQAVYEGYLNGKLVEGSVTWMSGYGTQRQKWKATWTGADDWPVKYTAAEEEAAKKGAAEKQEAETIANMAEKIANARIDAMIRQQSEAERQKQEQQAEAERKKKAAEEAAVTNRPVSDKWALVVGISAFNDRSLNLKYPTKDAEAFYNYLLKEAKFAPDHVKLLRDGEATRTRILSELGDVWLPRVVHPDDLVVFYFSSHGSPSELDINGLNYLVAYDTNPQQLFATGVPMQDLVRTIHNRVKSDRVILVLDACYSGATDIEAKGLARSANIDVDQLMQGSGQLIISSSEPQQRSWESKSYSNGVFTHYLIEGLRSRGMDTKLGEAFSFMRARVQEEVLRDRGILQTPVMKSKWQGNDLVIAAPPASPRPGLSVPALPSPTAPPAVPASSPRKAGVQRAADKSHPGR